MDAQAQFEGFLSKYEPGVAAEAKKSLAKLRKLIPNAIEMVYDNYNVLGGGILSWHAAKRGHPIDRGNAGMGELVFFARRSPA